MQAGSGCINFCGPARVWTRLCGREHESGTLRMRERVEFFYSPDMLLLYTSDLHGHARLYDQLYALLDRERPDAVILGGDICPTRFGPDGPPIQRRFLEALLERFDHYGDAGTPFFLYFFKHHFRRHFEHLAP